MRKVDFIGIGTIKSGSSFLADLIAQHPQVSWARRKEVNYFNPKNVNGSPNFLNNKGIEAYEAFFIHDTNNGTVKKGEFSPIYLSQPPALKAILEYNTDVRLLVILRNPVKRCYSHFLYDQGFNQLIDKKLSFREALDEHPYLLKLGEYGLQLSYLFEQVNRDQVHVMIMEDFVKSPLERIKDVYKHIDVDPYYVPKVRKINVGKKVRSTALNTVIHWPGKILKSAMKIRVLDDILTKYFYSTKVYSSLLAIKHDILDRNVVENIVAPTMDAAIVKSLNEYYREDISLLEDLLDMDLSLWLEA